MKIDPKLKNTEYLSRLKTVYKQADEICKANKDVDRDIVVQSLLMRYQSPLENLNFALMRAKPYKKS